MIAYFQVWKFEVRTLFQVLYRPHTYSSEKCKEYEIRFMDKTTLFRRDFLNLNKRAARTALSSNVHEFCKPKSSCFMREMAVTRISFSLELLMLYEVYTNQQQKIFS